jgi:hypothetical protein
MTSERVQRRIEALLDEADEAITREDWAVVAARARAVLSFDEANADARAYLEAAQKNLDGSLNATAAVGPPGAEATGAAYPSTFVGGRYHVRRFLGEGGKKKVFLAHDESLDRDVAFALIKTEGLDATGRERIVREAQAMGRLGAHPHVVTIFEIGEEAGAPYVVTELMGGGDIEGLIEKAGGALPLERSLALAKDVCRGLVFAHAQGIVHRDLKPGNVWLTTDGVAKIGDFGLAVNLSRSRLTQHGLMVGTVAYMPPEQALGGEVTTRSDLYSLGAMLYELVTGKPPFQADDPTAVISQHINTPPVAPSWNSDRCPPDLEALILRLLAKVPAERPANAAEVLAALERVNPDAKSASHSDSQANPLDRLARGVFVGRERELERLRSAFDDAFAGRGSVVMLVGEPGIGKTRTVQEVETYARMRGAQVYWGRADESAGAPPYRPWRQVAASYRAQNPDETRRKEWGDNAVELQRIFPALRDLFPNLPAPPDTESEEGQYRLFEAMSEFIRGVSERIPLLIVLDDLHWSDRATLQMLTHSAREIARSRILVLGTYRDTDLDRTHPLSAALAELSREQLFTRIPLRGLDRKAVASYIAATAHTDPPTRLVDRIFEETEGNPFFLSEVVNLMTQEGTLARATSTSTSDIAIPEGVKEALGRRLDRLSPAANQLLTLAAVAGREFNHALLVALTGQDDEAVLRLAEEALAGRVIEETGAVGAYRFTHALMQETLASELSAARKVRVHGQIAQALEAIYGPRADTNAQELARHYSESAVLNRAHAGRAAHYSRIAGEEATAHFAWADAARHFQNAVEVDTDTPMPPGESAELLLRAAHFWRLGGIPTNGTRAAVAALSLARDADADVLYARAAFEVTQTSSRVEERRQLADEALVRLGDADLHLRARLLAARAGLFRGVGSFSSFDNSPLAAKALSEARSLATREEFLDVLAELGTRDAMVAFNEGRPSAAIEAFRRSYRATSDLGLYREALASLRAIAYQRLVAGQLDHARSAAEEMIAFAQEHRLADLGAVELVPLLVAFHRGDFDEARRWAERFPDETGYRHLFPAGIAEQRGDFAEALATFESSSAADGVYRRALARAQRGDGSVVAAGQWFGAIARVNFHAGNLAAATVAFEEWLAFVAPEPLISTARLLTYTELDDALVAFADDALATPIYGELSQLQEVRVHSRSLDRLRGDLAVRFGDLEAAAKWYERGRLWANRERTPVLEGRCTQGLADLAEAQRDHTQAMQHLDAAGELFARHGPSSTSTRCWRRSSS